MSHSRKDARGGHRRTWLGIGVGSVVCGESDKRYGKRFRSKLARRHGRLSLRDLAVIEPDDWTLHEEAPDWTDEEWYAYMDDAEEREWERGFDRDHYEDIYFEDAYDERNYEDERYDLYEFEYEDFGPPGYEPIHQYLRNVGTYDDCCWVPCAKGDPGAVRFVPECEEL